MTFGIGKDFGVLCNLFRFNLAVDTILTHPDILFTTVQYFVSVEIYMS